ncbi:MAG: DUF2339 domain-containing protein [Gallionellaceae bacterium]|jgi:uncharacterized membrane protein
MTIILVIIGAIFGASTLNFSGFVAGAVLGYLLGTVLNLREQLIALKLDVKLLMANRAAQNAESTQAADTQVAETSPVHTFAFTTTPPEEQQISAAEAAAERVAELERQATESMPAEPAMPAPVRTQTIPQPVAQSASHYSAPAPVDEPAVLRYLREYFSGPHLLVRVGVIVLFFGVAFLLKYAAERTHLPIELRLMGVAAGAMVMLVIGWRLRNKYEDYALVMQGGAIGVLYLTVFSALRLFEVLPAAYALFILTAVGIFSAILAIVQNARSLAILGICGGFLAPVLTSTGEGNHVVLFSYYALLNAGIFGMAWFKSWRLLNLLGFAFTFVISTFWGVTRYQAEHFASTEPFLILFFLFYVAIAVLYATRQAPDLKNYVDGTLVFGTPIIAFGLQAGMTQQYAMLQLFEYGLAVSAVALSLFYLSLAKILFERRRDSLRLLVEAFLALGVVFGTLAIPLALDGRWTAAAWALEGAAVLWMGIRQQRVLPRLFGTLLQFAAGISLLTDYHYHAAPLAILNSVYLGAVLVSFAALFSAWFLERNKSTVLEFELALASLLFGWGLLWWLGAGLREIDRFVPNQYNFMAALIFIALSSAAFSLLHKKLSWPAAKIPALGLLPAMVLIAYIQWFAAPHLFAHLGYIGWGLAFATLYWILRRDESDTSTALVSTLHMVSLWLLAFILSHETAWAINDTVQGLGTWPLIAWALVPGLLLGGLSVYGQRLNWPVAAHLQTYLGIAALPLAGFLWLWSLFTNLGSDGNPYPLNYLPILNPLDLAQIFVFLVLAAWLLKLRQLEMPVFAEFSQQARYAVIAATLFVWLNAALLRTLHYWAAVPFNTHSMMNSVLVQASVSIFWSVLAMALMRYAAQKQNRTVWMAGGVLMAAVVLKLFTIDISGSGSLERIVSFIGVAVLMLVIGYIAPLPAKQEEAENHA